MVQILSNRPDFKAGRSLIFWIEAGRADRPADCNTARELAHKYYIELPDFVLEQFSPPKIQGVNVQSEDTGVWI